MKKTILFCGNGMSGEVIESLSEDYNILLISEFPNDVGINHVKKYISANSKDPEEALNAAEQLWNSGYRFDAVISLCWDCPISVSLISKKFNLKGLPIEAAINSSDKRLRSNIFVKSKIISPKYEIIKSYGELSAKVIDFGFPLIIKPVNLSSSKGVVLVNNFDELLTGYQYCREFTQEPLIINEYVSGIEFSAEGLMINESLFMTGLSERIFKYKEYSPFFVEVGDILPTNLTEEMIIKIKDLVERASLSLGIKSGIVKADLIINSENEVFILELTPRLGGPRFGTEIVKLSNGTDVLRAALQQLLNQEINYDYLTPKFSKGVVSRSLFPSPGVFKSIEGLDTIRNFEGYYDYKWWNIDPFEIGEEIISPKYGCGSFAYFISFGQTREEAIRNANNIEDNIKVNVE